MFNGSNDYFSVDHFDTYYSSVYKHNQQPFQTYYGERYPHIVDFIVHNDPFEVKTTQYVTYTSKATLWDDFTNQWVDTPKTYSSVTAYNNRQTTGEIGIKPKFNNFEIDMMSNDMLAARVENQWRLNNFWDLTINNTTPVWDASWTARQSSPFSYIDKVPNSNNINYNKSLFEQARFRDHYLGLRFKFDLPENLKITTDLVTTVSSNKNR